MEMLLGRGEPLFESGTLPSCRALDPGDAILTATLTPPSAFALGPAASEYEYFGRLPVSQLRTLAKNTLHCRRDMLLLLLLTVP